MKALLTTLIYSVLLLVGCDNNEPDSRKIIAPEFSDNRLTSGRNIWMNTCRNCHLFGVAGAPSITDSNAWKIRREKSLESLYESAIHGIKRDDKWLMPPRGGNNKLSDEQIRLSVDYMLAAVDRLMKK